MNTNRLIIVQFYTPDPIDARSLTGFGKSRDLPVLRHLGVKLLLLNAVYPMWPAPFSFAKDRRMRSALDLIRTLAL